MELQERYILVLGIVSEILELPWEDRHEVMKRSLDLIIDLGNFFLPSPLVTDKIDLL